MKENNLDAILGKEIFTTGDVALICGISQQTVIRCFDEGSLKGFRVPGSKFRRIPRSRLLEFIRDNNLDMALLKGTVQSEVLVLSQSKGFFDKVDHSLKQEFVVLSTSDTFEAGILFAKDKILLIDGFYSPKEVIQGMLNSISQVERSGARVFLVNNLDIFDIPRGVVAFDRVPSLEDIRAPFCYE